jgi:quinol monooxygenase YgiN
MMILSLFGNLLILGVVIFVINRVFFQRQKQANQGGGVRRFFQLGLLFALVVISAIGLSGLLARLLHIGISVTSDRAALALESSFTAVGIPLLFLVATWTRRTIAKDPSEKETMGWNLYLTATSILAIVLNLVAQLKIYKVIFADGVLQGNSISQFVIWGAIWFIHFRLLSQVRNSFSSIKDHLIGSLIGLGFSVYGLLAIIEALLTSLFHFNKDLIIFSETNLLMQGFITFIVGAPVWYVYWIRTALTIKKDGTWFAYVLLIGVGGGLIVAVTAFSFNIYSALVWLMGDPATQSASVHFQDSPGSLAAASVGLLVIWYHRAVLSRENTQERTDIRRIYEYGIAGIGLIAAAGGVTMIIVSFVESISNSTQILGGSSINSILAAITLIAVGGPIWWFVWRSIQKTADLSPTSEHSSLIRRIYLLILFGVLGIVSVVMLLLGAYFIFKDLFQQGIGIETLRRIRFPLGILLTTALVSFYHWLIFRGEKDVEVQRSSAQKHEGKLYFFVEVTIKPTRFNEYLAALNKYAEHIRGERGCEKLDVLIEPKNPSTIYLYEIWSDASTHQSHLDSAEFSNWKEFSNPLTELLKVKTLKTGEI